MATKRLLVGVIGAGANTRKLHIPNLEKIEGVQVVAIANRTVASAQAVVDGLAASGGKATDDWTQVTGDKDIDAIMIGTWPYMHKTLVLAALAAGKHVLTEARMALDAQEAREMLAASRRHPKQIVQIVPSPLIFTWEPALKHILDSGRLGTVFYAEVKSIGNSFSEPQGAAMHWRHDMQLSGLNIGTFGIAIEPLLRLLGDASSVTAVGQTIVKQRRDGATGELKGVRIPDHLTATIQLAAGVQAQVLVSSVIALVKFDGDLATYGGVPHADGKPVTHYSFYGTEGTLHLDVTAKTLQLVSRDGKVEDVKPEPTYSWRVEEEFVGAIRGQEQIVKTSFVDGVRYMEVTEAITISMQERRTVGLPLLHRS